MPAKKKLKPEPKAFSIESIDPPHLTPSRATLKLTLAWAGVLIPLGWGIFKTLQKAALLLQI